MSYRSGMPSHLLWSACIVLSLAACSPAATSDTGSIETPNGNRVAQDNVEGMVEVAAPSENIDLESLVQSMGIFYLPETPPAIQFRLSRLSGGQVDFSDYYGKVVLLNFWATWCGPCRAEMPSMQVLYDQLKGTDFEMLAVDSMEEEGLVGNFIQQYGYTFPVLLDSEGVVSNQYALQAIPTTYLIDKQGRVIGGKAGAHDWSNPAVLRALRTLIEQT